MLNEWMAEMVIYLLLIIIIINYYRLQNQYWTMKFVKKRNVSQ